MVSTDSSCHAVFSEMEFTGEVSQAIQRKVPSEEPDGARREAAVKFAAGTEAVSMLPSGVNFPASLMF